MDIDKLKAGRELDALVAEKVMELPGVGYYKRESVRHGGWIPAVKGDVTDDYPAWKAGLYYIPRADEYGKETALALSLQPRAIPHYSTDIAAAWEVLDKLIELKWHPSIWYEPAERGMEWVIELLTYRDGEYPLAYGDTPMLAICRAALIVVDQMRNV